MLSALFGRKKDVKEKTKNVTRDKRTTKPSSQQLSSVAQPPPPPASIQSPRESLEKHKIQKNVSFNNQIVVFADEITASSDDNSTKDASSKFDMRDMVAKDASSKFDTRDMVGDASKDRKLKSEILDESIRLSDYKTYNDAMEKQCLSDSYIATAVCVIS